MALCPMLTAQGKVRFLCGHCTLSWRNFQINMPSCLLLSCCFLILLPLFINVFCLGHSFSCTSTQCSEKAMAPHSSTLAWKIPWAEEPGRLQSMGLLRVGHGFTFTFHFHALEKEMATHSSVLAWRIPGTGEPGGLPSMGSHRVGHN